MASLKILDLGMSAGAGYGRKRACDQQTKSSFGFNSRLARHRRSTLHRTYAYDTDKFHIVRQGNQT